MSLVSIVIPVFNSSECLDELLKTINKKVTIKHEIILINDQSTDESWKIIKKNSKTKKNILGINLLKNAGQDNAIMAGLNHAKGDYIVIMDDDLQHNPAEINSLYKHCLKGYDVVYANFIHKKQKYWRNFGSWLNGKVAEYFINKPKKLYISPFKIMNKKILTEILKYKSPYTYIDSIILNLTTNIDQIPAVHQKRFAGKSNYSFTKSINLFSTHFTSYSVFPLRLVTFIGLLFAFLGLISSIISIVNYFVSDYEPEGWTSMMIVLLLIGGFLMFSIGIVGEYLGRLYLLMSNKSQYVIKEKTR